MSESTPATTVELFGCRVAALTMDETVERVDQLVAQGTLTHHIGINAAAVLAMRDDARLAEIVAGSSFVSADGQSVVWASRVLGRPLPERVAGVDLFLALVDRAAEKGYPVFLLGAHPHIVERTCDVLSERCPQLQVAGSHHGYFDDDEGARIASLVRESGARMLFVGMSSPRKEYWTAEHLEAVGATFCMGVGGTFDVVSGAISRAPRWMQRSGLEWLHRLLKEPGRMWRRYLVGNVRFIWLVLKTRASQR